MTFSSLKKKSQSANRKQFTVDEFIEDALNYANGHSKVVSIHRNHQPERHEMIKNSCHEHKPLRHATFTLSEESIETLAKLSVQTDISRSRLLRIWLDEMSQHPDFRLFFKSDVR